MLELNHQGPQLSWLNVRPKTVSNSEPVEVISLSRQWTELIVIQNAMNSDYKVNTIRQEAGLEKGCPARSVCCSLDER